MKKIVALFLTVIFLIPQIGVDSNAAESNYEDTAICWNEYIKKKSLDVSSRTIGDEYVTSDETEGETTTEEKETTETPTEATTEAEQKYTGFKKDGNDTYYYKDGVKQTGWRVISGKKYYFSKKSSNKGVMSVGFTKIGKKTYYFDSKKIKKKGWQTIEKCKYYFSKKGVMQTGLKKIKNKRYYFMKDGKMADCGLYKNYIISYTGRCYKIPAKRTGDIDEDAKAIARVIAKCSGKGKKGMKDIEKVSRAAYIVSAFTSRASYSMSGPYYSKPYGVFIAKECSCSGCTRALGMVLTIMGFDWVHVNENQYTHQWISLKMDGKKGYADGQIGMVGYGKHPVDR